MSTEKPRLNNFAGLDGLEDLLSGFRLVVSQGYGQSTELEPGSTLSLSYVDLRDVGLEIKTNASAVDFLQAVGDAGLQAAHVDLVVVAEGSFLKNREIVFRGSILDVGDSVKLLAWKSVRGDALSDRRHGFKLEVCLILNRELVPAPLRPRRLGTVLAREQFSISPNKLANGLVPLPLTQAVIDESKGVIPRGTVLWVEVKGDLFDADALDEAITIYIDEDLHALLGRIRSPEAKLMQKQFAMEALAQITILASRDLVTREITEADEKSLLGQFLFQQLSKANPRVFSDVRGVLGLVKRDPSAAAAIFTSQFRYKDQLRRLLIEEDAT